MTVWIALLAGAGVCRAAGPFAYIAEPQLDRVSVIDTAARPLAVVATIPVGVGPAGVAVHPGRNRAYVGNGGSNTVSVIDTVANAVVATISDVGTTPEGVAVNPAGTRVYVAAFLNGANSQGDVAVIDTSTNTVIARIPTGNNPFFVAVDPGGTRLYAALVSSNTVAVIDTATNQIVGSIPVGSLPWAVAINPAPKTTLGYTANFGDDTVSVFRTDTNTLVTTIPIGNPAQIDHGMSVAVHPAGTRVYAGIDYDTAPEVWVINAALNQVVDTVDLDGSASFEANSMAVDPSGAYLYVTQGYGNSGSFWVVDTQTDQVVASLSGLGVYARGLGNFITGCSSDALCNDGNQCTTDACVNFTCTHTCATGQPCGSGCIAMVCQESGGSCSCAVQ